MFYMEPKKETLIFIDFTSDILPRFLLKPRKILSNFFILFGIKKVPLFFIDFTSDMLLQFLV